MSDAGKTLCKIGKRVVAEVTVCLATGVPGTLSFIFPADLLAFSLAGAIVGMCEVVVSIREGQGAVTIFVSL